MNQRTLIVVLFVSLAVNLFGLGALAGAGLFRDRLEPMRQAPRAPAGPMPGPLATVIAAVPPEQRGTLGAGLREQARAVGPQLREARALRREAWLRLGEDPFDRAAVERDLDRSRRMELEARTRIDGLVLDMAASLPKDRRGQIAQALAPPPRRGRDGPPLPVPP